MLILKVHADGSAEWSGQWPVLTLTRRGRSR